jgi:hypothetical protein
VQNEAIPRHIWDFELTLTSRNSVKQSPIHAAISNSHRQSAQGARLCQIAGIDGIDESKIEQIILVQPEMLQHNIFQLRNQRSVQRNRLHVPGDP